MQIRVLKEKVHSQIGVWESDANSLPLGRVRVGLRINNETNMIWEYTQEDDYLRVNANQSFERNSTFTNRSLGMRCEIFSLWGGVRAGLKINNEKYIHIH